MKLMHNMLAELVSAQEQNQLNGGRFLYRIIKYTLSAFARWCLQHMASAS
jgi:hypothetical protein